MRARMERDDTSQVPRRGFEDGKADEGKIIMDEEELETPEELREVVFCRLARIRAELLSSQQKKEPSRDDEKLLAGATKTVRE